MYISFRYSAALSLALLLPLSLDAQQLQGVKICSGGDVTLGTNLPHGSKAFLQHTPASLLKPLTPIVQDADIVLLNLEGAVGEGKSRSKCGPKSTNCFAFRSPPSAIPALKEFSKHSALVLNVANNHSLDAGERGLRKTLEYIKQSEVLATGADTLATIVQLQNGSTAALLGFSTSSGPSARDLDALKRHVHRAAQASEIVVVTVHMGAEGISAQRTRNKEEIFLKTIPRGNPVAFSHAAIDAGADLVIGHGPHVMRAMELYNERLIAYSLGNLLTYGPFSFAEPMNRGGLLCTVLDDEGRVVEAKLHSTKQRKPGLVSVDHTNKAATLSDSLGKLDFPKTRVKLDKEGHLDIPAPKVRLELPEPLPQKKPVQRDNWSGFLRFLNHLKEKS